MSPGRIMLIGPKALRRSVGSQGKRWKVQVVWFPRLTVETLLEPCPELVILDATVVECSSAAAIDQIRRVYPSVPVILIVGKRSVIRKTAVTQVSQAGLLECIASHFKQT